MADPNVLRQLLGGSVGGDAAPSGPALDEKSSKGADSLADLAESLGSQASKLTNLQTLSKQMWQLLPQAAQSMQSLSKAIQTVAQSTGSAVQALQRAGTATAGIATGRSPLAAASAAIATGPGGISPASAFPSIKLPDIAGKVTAALGDIGKGPGKGKGGLDGDGSKPIRVIIAGPWPLMVEDVGGKRQSGTPQQRVQQAGGKGGGGGSVFGGSGAMMAAGAGAVAAMGGLAGAASPALFNTLAGSIKILSGEIGHALTPAIVEASVAIQKIAYIVGNMSAETRKAIGDKLKFAGAMAGVAFAASKVAPAIGLIGGALKGLGGAIAGLGLPGLAIGLGVGAIAAVYFRKELLAMLPPEVVNRVADFGVAIQTTLGNLWDRAGPGIMQLGGAVMDLGGSLLHFGQAVLPLAIDAAMRFGQAVAFVAPVVGATLTGALKVCSGVIDTFASGLTSLNTLLGGGLGTTILVVTGSLYAWSVATRVVAASKIFLTATLAAATGGTNTLAGAWKVLTATMMANPIGAIATGLAIAVTGLTLALGALSTENGAAAKAARQVSDELAAQLAAAERLEPVLERIRGGGKVGARDAKQAFTAEQEAELRNAKDPRDQAVILGRIRNEARVVSEGKSVETLEKEEAEQAAKYKQGKGQRKNSVTGQWEDVSVSDEDARKRAAEDFAERKRAAMRAELAEKAMNQKEGIDFSGKSKPGTGGGAKDAMGGAMAKFKEEWDEQMKGLGLGGDALAGFKPVKAATHSIAPTLGSGTQLRNSLLTANVGKDAIERQQMEIWKKNEQLLENIWKLLAGTVQTVKDSRPSNIDNAVKV